MKKFLSAISAFFISLYSKVIAAEMVVLYGVPPPQADYGVPTPIPKLVILWRILQIFVIPIVLIIGIIVYLKKGKNPIIKKIIIGLMIVAIIVLIGFGMGYIVVNFLT